MKRLVQLLSLVALIALFAALGLVGYLVGTGRLDAERVDQIAKVLRGEWPQDAASTAADAEQEVKPETATSEIVRSRIQQEMLAMMALTFVQSWRQ